MAEHNEHDVFDDCALERAFASLDGVKAPKSLKASTLDAIFALADEEERAQESVDQASHDDIQTKSTSNTSFIVLEGGASKASGESSGEGLSSKKPSSAKARSPRLKLRVAAVLLVAALGIGGVAAYALPATHVYATSGDTTVDLGVNVFGITVSAEANSADGNELLKGVDVRNVRFEDAFERVLGAYENRDGGEAVSVRVESNVPFGGRERLSDQATMAVSSYERRRAESAPPDAEDGGARPEGDVHGMDEGDGSPDFGGSEQIRKDEGVPQGGSPQDGQATQEMRDVQAGQPEAAQGQPAQEQPTQGQSENAQPGGGGPTRESNGGQPMGNQPGGNSSEMGELMVE